MQCRTCHAEIADKAIICYRCGAPTTDAKYQPAPLPAARSGSGLIWVVAAIIALAVIALIAVRYVAR
jgi:hypothetical protein